jgi:hypothetical protein
MKNAAHIPTTAKYSRPRYTTPRPISEVLPEVLPALRRTRKNRRQRSKGGEK